MLVLSRKTGQRVLVGGEIVITVIKVSGGGVRIGIEAPPELPIVREELLDRFGLMRDSIASILNSSTGEHESGGSARYKNRLRADVAPR